MMKAMPVFNEPVQELFPEHWEAYQLEIQQPMDFGTIMRRLKEGAYTTAPDHIVHPDFIRDMKLVGTNCMDFNEAGSDIYQMAEAMLAKFHRMVEKKSKQQSPVVQEPTAPSPHG